jgi:restriction system protein
MALPKFDECLHPLLSLLAQRGPLSVAESTRLVADHFGLSEEEREAGLPSGNSTVVHSRVGWARTFLHKAGLIRPVSRGVWQATDAGVQALRAAKGTLTLDDLNRYQSFGEWKAQVSAARVARMGEKVKVAPRSDELSSESIGESPAERMERLHEDLRATVQAELQQRLRTMDSERFERLVEELLVRMGYGASADELRRALRSGSGDNGVDGVIKEDRLGLGQIYIQAKRWDGRNVRRPDIQAFVGAMHGHTDKGVFFTSASFSDEARDFAKHTRGLRIRLVDGAELASMMLDAGIGVVESGVYRTYRVDAEFFGETE